MLRLHIAQMGIKLPSVVGPPLHSGTICPQWNSICRMRVSSQQGHLALPTSGPKWASHTLRRKTFEMLFFLAGFFALVFEEGSRACDAASWGLMLGVDVQVPICQIQNTALGNYNTILLCIQESQKFLFLKTWILTGFIPGFVQKYSSAGNMLCRVGISKRRTMRIQELNFSLIDYLAHGQAKIK